MHIRGLFFEIWVKKGDLGLIWSKFSECFSFPKNLHKAQFRGAEFESGVHFSKL